MEEMRITLTEGHTFEVLDVEDVYVTSDIVIPGEGSSNASFSALQDADLCACVPELGVIRDGIAGVASPYPQFEKNICLGEN